VWNETSEKSEKKIATFKKYNKFEIQVIKGTNPNQKLRSPAVLGGEGGFDLDLFP
jgi:hypothetical protein